MTPDQVNQFKRDGYYIDRGVFGADELPRLRELARDIQSVTRKTLPSGTRFWFGKTEDPANQPREVQAQATWGVNEITRRSFFQPELVNVWAHPRVDAAMNALLQEPRAWGIKILWTPKVVSYNLHWHRDQMKPAFYDYIQYKLAAQDHVQFNAALNDDECFIVVPGSHRRALTEAEWKAVREDRTAELPGQVTAKLAPGDILYMDAHALHRGRSDTAGDRLTLHYSAQSQWVPLQEWGSKEDFAFMISDEFINRLAPAAQLYYLRLRTARRTTEAMSFAHEAAEKHGWKKPVREMAAASM